MCTDRLEFWEWRQIAGQTVRSVSRVILGCLIRKACGARCSGGVIPAHVHIWRLGLISGSGQWGEPWCSLGGFWWGRERERESFWYVFLPCLIYFSSAHESKQECRVGSETLCLYINRTRIISAIALLTSKMD